MSECTGGKKKEQQKNGQKRKWPSVPQPAVLQGKKLVANQGPVQRCPCKLNPDGGGEQNKGVRNTRKRRTA